MLTKCNKYTLNTRDMKTLYSLRAAKYKKYEFQSLLDFKETGDGLVKFQFKLGYAEAQLFVAVPMNSYKNVSFTVHVQQTYIK